MAQTEISSMHDFDGRTAVITGGTGAFGGEMACALVACGANVVMLDLRPPGADLSSRLKSGPGQSLFVQGDVLDRQSLLRARDEVVATFGPAEMLLNVAGGHHPEATTGPSLSFFDLPTEALRFVLDLNLFGTILPTQVFGRDMAERGEGVILNITSASSFRSLTRVIAYSASKAAVNNFTRWLAVHMAQEYSPRIRVNALAPGFYLTSANRDLLSQEGGKVLTERGRVIVGQTPMGRLGTPEELISTVLWLLSPASTFVTGVVVPVDGGFTAFSGV